MDRGTKVYAVLLSFLHDFYRKQERTVQVIMEEMDQLISRYSLTEFLPAVSIYIDGFI